MIGEKIWAENEVRGTPTLFLPEEHNAAGSKLTRRFCFFFVATLRHFIGIIID